MQYDLTVWEQLYKLTHQIKELKPWEYIWSNEFICIELEEDQYTYCTVMGKNGNCFGISVYKGDDGYADLCSVSHEYPDLEMTKYVMYEQRCLTWYLGDNCEVPREQKDIMKALGLRFRGHNHWPYFLSFESRFYPTTFNDEEARYFVQVLEKLIDVFNEYQNGRIDVDFERSEMIFAHIENQRWVYESMSLPDEIDKFSPIELVDQTIFQKMNEIERTNKEIYIDLFYLSHQMKEQHFDKPVNPLMFLVIDKRSEMILYGELIGPDKDEIEVILNYLVNYIFQNGIPHTIYFRNPNIFCALTDICDHCYIRMEIDHFSLVNEIIEGIARAI